MFLAGVSLEIELTKPEHPSASATPIIRFFAVVMYCNMDREVRQGEMVPECFRAAIINPVITSNCLKYQQTDVFPFPRNESLSGESRVMAGSP